MEHPFTWLNNSVNDVLASTKPEYHESIEATADRFRLALLPVVRQLRRQGNTPVPAGALSALAALDRHDEMNAGELARYEHVTGPMITRVVKLLVEEGLITKSPSPADGRVALLRPTAKGRKLVHRRREAKNAWLARRLAALDPAEVEAIRQVLPVLERLADREMS